MPARWKAWNQFSRPLQSSLLVAGGGGSSPAPGEARQESGAFSLNAFPGPHDGTVPYLPQFTFFLPGGRLIHKQGTHKHTLLWPCPRVDAAQNVVRLSVERGRRRHERDGSQKRQKVDDIKTPNLWAVTCPLRSKPSIPKRRRHGLDESSTVREGVDEAKSHAASKVVTRPQLGDAGHGCPVHG